MKLICFACAFFLAGCASAQLNSNTIDIASSSHSLLTAQVLDNFANYIDDAAAFPSQLVINSGSTTTTNSIGASASNPLTEGVQSTYAAVTSAAASVTNTRQATAAGAAMGLSANNVAGQTYSYDLITDFEKAKRLNALYRYAVTWSHLRNGETKFVANFPTVRKTVTHNEPECTTGHVKSGGLVSPHFSNTAFDVDMKPQQIEFCATGQVSSGDYSHSGGTQSYSSQIADETYLRGTDCIVCRVRGKYYISDNISGAWLVWYDFRDGGDPSRYYPPTDYVSLGSSGHYAFYVASDKAEKFVNFEMDVLAASTLTSSSVQGGAGGGGNNGQATTPKAQVPYELSIPVL